MDYARRLSMSRLLVLAVLLCARAVSGSLAPNDVWAGEAEPSGKVASFLPQSDLLNLSRAAKSLEHMLGLAESLKPRGLFRLTGAPKTFPFCTALDLSEAVVPNLFEVLTAHRFPSLVSVDLRGHKGEPVIPSPLPVLTSVNNLSVSQDFLHFHLLPEVFPNLQSLTVKLSWPRRVVDCSFLGRFPSLEKVDALICSIGAREAAALPQSLTVLRVGSVEAPFTLPHLQELTVRGRWMLPDLNTLEASSRSLRKLEIQFPHNLLDLQSLRLMGESLEELNLSRFTLTDEMQVRLEVISLLTNLRSLHFEPWLDSSTAPLDALKVFGSRLLALETLELRTTSAVNMQNFLNSVPMLNSLSLDTCELRDHRSLDVSNLVNLESLSLEATELTNLHLWNETLHTGATGLLYLDAGSTRAVHGLQHLRLLQVAELEGTAVLPEDIAQLVNLTHLTCPGIPYVEPLAALVHLEYLNIYNGDTPDLSQLVGFDKLIVYTRESGMGAPIAQVLAHFPPINSR